MRVLAVLAACAVRARAEDGGLTDDGICKNQPWNALLFPFVFLLLGAATIQLAMKYVPNLPYTVLMMVEGFLVDWWASLANDSCPLNPMQQTLDLWAHMDGQLILFAFLPALLFGDSMTLNMHLFKRAFWQCAYLAVLGVVGSAALTAVIAWKVMPYHWGTFSIWMTVGAILASTDPVAIVALLRSVGASPILTMQITGESLFNDGGSMVLYKLFFDMYLKRDGDPPAEFLARQFIVAPLIGILCGGVTVVWLGWATRRFSPEHATIQLVLTISCAYVSYFVAEYSDASGVLSTVSAGLVVALRAWPLVVEPEAMESVWNFVEHAGNTLIFALVGVITRRSVFGQYIQPREYGYAVVLYLVVLVGRAGMVLLSYPVLKNIGYGLDPAGASFMVWGGLRGAVGLALALNTYAELRETGKERVGKLVLFHVAAVSFLTMIINGTTARYVVQWLGLVRAPEARLRLRAKVRESIQAHAAEAYARGCLAHEHDAEDALEHVTALHHLRDTARARPAAASRDVAPERRGFTLEEAEGFVAAFERADAALDEDELALLRETLYHVVKAEYWAMIEAGDLPRHSRAALELLEAADAGLDDTRAPLRDFALMRATVKRNYATVRTDACFQRLDDCLPTCCTLDNRIHYALAYARHEAAYYATRAFVAAHRRAQHQLADFYGHERVAGDGPETLAEAVVIRESAQQCARAERHIAAAAPGLVKLVKSDIIARNVIDIQHELVARLARQGVLTPAGAAEISKELETDRVALETARRRKAEGIAILHVHRKQNRVMSRDLSANRKRFLEMRLSNVMASSTVSADDEAKGGVP